ncbi:hypothetical protein [Neolewinella agarilytica]|uniref:hypothetical protein n=1 Tax=Neolewinella agarilytica TaxID=478744 RepID=UPI0023527545|nr:hypothetical protein [Neolewinella agarilytica]
MKFCFLRVAIIVGILFSFAEGQSSSLRDNWPADFSASLSLRTQHQQQTLFSHQYPFVALPSRPLENAAIPDLTGQASTANGIMFQDLRGVECYAQPDALVVCGLGDTIPILLFTKSEEPIYDVELNVRFDLGLEYASFAYVDDPTNQNNADLDTINVDNSRSPTFRISEISQAGGGVVVYVGVSAACGIDFDSYMPSIAFNLSYLTADGTACEETIRPEQGYASNVLSPVPRFTGSASPATANFTDLSTPNCITTNLTNITPGAGLTEAFFQVDNYGFDAGVTLSSLSVNGIAIPASDLNIDMTTGLVQAFIDGRTTPTYWGSDGQLTFTESIAAEACFEVTGCTGIETNPIFSVQSACRGESCGGSVDVENGATLSEQFTFNPTPNITFTQLEDPAFCAPDEPSPYVYETSITSTITDSIRGDLYNLRYFVDRCPERFLELSTVSFLDAPQGNVIGVFPDDAAVLQGAGANGRIVIDIRDFPAGLDVDGPGGLEDIDEDGVFDDLPAGRTIYLRIELLPTCDPSALPTDGFDNGGFDCDFFRHFVQGSRNCGINTFSTSATFNDGVDAADNSSFAGFTNTSVLEVRDIDYDGYHNPGTYNSANPDTVMVTFEYQLADDDFAACPTDGEVKLRVNFDEVLAQVVEDFEIIEPTFNGVATSVTEDTLIIGTATRSFTIDAGSAQTSTVHSYSFKVVMDSVLCSPRRIISLTAFVQQECEDCSCSLTRAGGFTNFTVDPANPTDCTAASSRAFVKRISTGYPSRNLSSGQYSPDDIPEEDQVRFLPGDTLEVSGWIAVDNPVEWNNLNQRISFSLNHFQGASGSQRPLVNHRIGVEEARLQYARLERTSGEVFDLGAVPVPGDQSQNVSGISGANVVIQTSNPEDNIHPGISNDDYTSGIYRNSATDFRDQNDIRLSFFADYEIGDQNALVALYDFIGGNFLQDDTIFLSWRLPVYSTPEVLANGAPTFYVPSIDSAEFGFIVEARNFADFETRSGTGPGQVGVSPRFNDRMYFHEPGVRTTTRLEWSPDGCSAELVQSYITTNPVPDDWYQDEFRPIIGVEYLQAEIPRPFYYNGEGTVTHFDQPAQPLVADSSNNLVAVDIGGVEHYLPVTDASGQLIFRDAEYVDGLRADDFSGFDQGDNDKALTGGTFPMLGVGLGEEVDSLVFRIPLERACGTAPEATPLETVTSISYRALHDYNSPGYVCSDGSWYSGNGTPLGSCAGFPSRYWPYDREDDLNPHHLANDVVSQAIESGTPPTAYNSTQSFSPVGPIVDGSGTESITFELNLPQAIPGGVIVFTAEDAVDIQSINGLPPVAAGENDSLRAFVLDLGALNAGAYNFDLITDLSYCGPGTICARVVLGCNDSPAEIGEILLQSDLQCGTDNEVCLDYISGLPDIDIRFTFQNSQQLCAEEMYSIAFVNTGGSDLANFFPTFYLPEGFVFLPGTWNYNIAGMATMPIADPVENTLKTGVNGSAFEFPAGTFPDLTEGETIIFSFTGTTECGGAFGAPLAAELNSSAACDREFMPDLTRSDPIRVAAGNDPTPSFTFNNATTQINCSGTEPLIITAVNTGKGPSTDSEVCLLLPPGIDLTADDISFLAPAGATVEDFTIEPLGTGGSQKLCFSSPATAIGGFFCVSLDLRVDLECGPADIAIQVNRTDTLFCQGMACEVQIADAAEQFIPLEVVPGIAVIDGGAVAECSSEVGTIDIGYELSVYNPGAAYEDTVTVDLIFDIDGSGTIDDSDPLIGSERQLVSLPLDGEAVISGTIPVDAEDACPILIRANVPGCACGEVIIDPGEILPDFVADLGTDVVLCPGEDYVINGLCGEVDFSLVPPNAGEVMLAGDSITLSLNPGFGVVGPVTLEVTSTIGSCLESTSQINVSAPLSFDFDPLSFDACQEGCQQLDLGINVNLLEDLEINITPTTYLSDSHSATPEICDPQEDITYTIEYILNGQCMTSSTMEINTFATPTASLLERSACSAGFRINDILTVTPDELDGFFTTQGDGYFRPSARRSDNPEYISGPEDIARGEVQLTFRSENPDGPCAGAVVRQSFPILLVDCGTFFWEGDR